MRLKSVRVREFKSVVDSGEIEIGDITCLVGKNEAGKTAVLEALYRLHPVIDSHDNFNVTLDYPRTDVGDYEYLVQTGKREPATVVTAVYELSDDDVVEVEGQFGADFLVDRLAKLWRGYENQTHLEINLDEKVAVRHLVAKAELPDDVRADAAKASTLEELLATLTAAAANQKKAHEDALDSAGQLENSDERAKATDAANRLQESASAKQLRSDISTYLEEDFQEYVWNTYLDHKVPKFLYFDEYYQMEGQVNIQELKERQANESLTESDRPMLGLIELARLNIDQLLEAKDTQALLNPDFLYELSAATF